MSGPFYPGNKIRHNPNREARVKQLITQTTSIQSTFESTEEQIKKLTAIEKSVFDNVAKAAGYPTAEQYIAAGLSALTPAQKANYQHICDTLIIHNPHLKNGMMATGIIAGVGWGLKVIRAVQDGVEMIRGFATLIRVNWTRKLVGGVDIAEKTASGLRWVKRAGKFLQWAGVIAEAALLIYTLVEGEKEKETLQAAIIETCSSRFGAKKIQLLVNQSMLWTSKTAGIVTSMNFMLQKKKEQEEENDPDLNPALKITKEQIDKEVLKDLNKLVDKFDEELASCNTDDKVIGDLAILDSKDAGGAWTTEDPKLDAMKQWIVDHPFKDKDGNVVPIDGPVSGNHGLVWTQSGPVKVGSANTEVRITGTNDDATKSQRFSSVHVSIPLSAKDGLFAKSNFKIAGTDDAGNGDGTFGIETSGGVTGTYKLSTVQKPSAAGSAETYLQFDCEQSEVLVPVDMPAKGSITFVLKGTIGAAGKSALLVRENWWPKKSNDKVWEDCVVEKTA
ncbi:hypothetical protein PG993_013151 [Apiospora rasikravindrae]|uniref:Uncharacterized protein n=1 Tax=Apiospora rasikravindrae TaxID=990691 RepID=A0ABR1RYW7_9PEZI